MKKKLFAILALMLAMIIALPTLADDEAIVKNGGFDVVGGDGSPEYWSFHSYEAEYLDNYDNSFAVCEQDPERGGVLHISSLQDDDAAVFQSVTVEPLTIYKLTCWIRTEAVENGAGANIALRDIIAVSDGLYGDNGWKQVQLVGKTGPNQTELVISCRVGGYSAVAHGDAWFDDFTVEKLESWSGDVIPFYSGIIDDDVEKGGGSIVPAVLIGAGVLLAAAVVLILVLKNRNGADKGGEALPSPITYSYDKTRKLTPMQELNGRSFFDMRSDSMPEPTDLKLHFTKKDRIYIIVLTAVYGLIALFRLGTLSFPTNAWKGDAGDKVRIEFGGSYKISEVWQNSGISYTNYVLRTDSDEEIAFETKKRAEYGHMFRWAKLSNNTSAETTGVTLEVISGDVGRKDDPDLVLNELVFFDENGEKIPCIVDQSAAALFDEQDTVPAYTSCYNGMYFDELYHGRTALEHINNQTVYEWTHPPLGKLIIAVGILIFGMKPFGWRIMGTVFGIAMVPIMYCFGKRLLKDSKLALFSTFIFAFDFMHFTQTRISTVDVYGVFFILLMTYYMYQFISMDIGDSVKSMMKPLALSGIFFGLGCASKWICLYTGVGLAVLFFVKLILMGVKSKKLSKLEKYKDRKLVSKYWGNALTLCCWCLIFFVVVPAVIYSASYFRYYTAQWKPARQAQIYTANYEQYASVDDVKLTLKDAADTYFSGVIKNQQDMYNYHSQLKSDHSAASPWWMWLANLRPTWFYVGGHDNPHGYVGTISAFGNPAVWLPCNIAMLILIFVLIFRRRKFPLEAYFLFVCAASSLLPWVLVPRSTYAYHFFATVPYITLGAGYLLGYWEKADAIRKSEKGLKQSFVPKVKYIWMALAGFMFILFYPVISGLEVPYEYIALLQWVPFHKWEIQNADGEVLRTYRMGWRFLDYEPHPVTEKMITIIKK
ncbi:MAG: glycosyltransferase family 39 protein [Clostridia bacterium]|nr:glycosyltransferase family 39 protein [Clostridia bacterium]